MCDLGPRRYEIQQSLFLPVPRSAISGLASFASSRVDRFFALSQFKLPPPIHAVPCCFEKSGHIVACLQKKKKGDIPNPVYFPALDRASAVVTTTPLPRDRLLSAVLFLPSRRHGQAPSTIAKRRLMPNKATKFFEDALSLRRLEDSHQLLRHLPSGVL